MVLAQVVAKVGTQKWQKCRSGVTIYRYGIEEVERRLGRSFWLRIRRKRPKSAKSKGGPLFGSLFTGYFACSFWVPGPYFRGLGGGVPPPPLPPLPRGCRP